MSYAILRWFILFISVFAASHLSFLRITYNSVTDLALAALLLSIFNSFLKPVLVLVSLPLILISLGLFLLVINALLLYFVSWLIPGFHVPTFGAALGGSIVISIVSLFLGADFNKVKIRRINSPRSDGRPEPPTLDI